MKRLRDTRHKQSLILRLKRIEGQLRGLQRLIGEEAPCEAIAQQLSASRRALDKAHHALVACLIETQLSEKGLPEADTRSMVELLSRYG